MATIDVKDATGTTVAIEKPLAPGRASAAASRPVVLSTEDAAYLDGLESAIASTNTKLDTLHTDVTAATPAGTNLIGRAVADASAATGGIASTSRVMSAAASTNATSAKTSAGRLYSIQGYNAAATVRYLKLYNKSSAPTVGTDTPVKTLALPPGCAFAFDWSNGYSFSAGIAYALTTGSADSDTGSLTSGDILGLNVDYN